MSPMLEHNGRFGYLRELDLSVLPEAERPWYAKLNAHQYAKESVWHHMHTGDTRECERQLDVMIQLIRELELGPWDRFTHLLAIADLRWEVKHYNRKKHLRGRSRWYWLIFEFLRGPWREPNHW
ncbi:MAG: hypothetical protein L0Z53_13885 [Acidobacteriales bacterium]|nr:hypothetical protein [Terriglobales bacterium]